MSFEELSVIGGALVGAAFAVKHVAEALWSGREPAHNTDRSTSGQQRVAKDGEDDEVVTELLEPMDAEWSDPARVWRVREPGSG